MPKVAPNQPASIGRYPSPAIAGEPLAARTKACSR